MIKTASTRKLVAYGYGGGKSKETRFTDWEQLLKYDIYFTSPSQSVNLVFTPPWFPFSYTTNFLVGTVFITCDPINRVMK